MHRILVTEPEYLSEEALGVLRSVGDVTAKRVSRKELEHIIRDVDVIFVRVDTKLDARMLELAGRLKLIASVTTGLNHIDLEAAKKKGIKVINLHGTHTVPTAEHTMALILALSRNIPWAYDNIRQGRWERYKFIGKLLNGKTLGIIGMGRIGSQVARYAKAFGMRVVAYDPYVKSSEVAMMESLDKLLREADVITIHTMLTHETRGMIGQQEPDYRQHDERHHAYAAAIAVTIHAVVHSSIFVEYAGKAYIRYHVSGLEPAAALRGWSNRPCSCRL